MYYYYSKIITNTYNTPRNLVLIVLKVNISRFIDIFISLLMKSLIKKCFVIFDHIIVIIIIYYYILLYYHLGYCNL